MISNILTYVFWAICAYCSIGYAVLAWSDRHFGDATPNEMTALAFVAAVAAILTWIVFPKNPKLRRNFYTRP